MRSLCLTYINQHLLFQGEKQLLHMKERQGKEGRLQLLREKNFQEQISSRSPTNLLILNLKNVIQFLNTKLAWQP